VIIKPTPPGVSIAGTTESGATIAAVLSPAGAQHVEVTGPLTAFGELQVAESTPVIQLKWPHGYNDHINHRVEYLSGTVTTPDGELCLSTGTTTGGQASNRSHRTIEYAPGQGVEARFSARFAGAEAGAGCCIGLGDAENGFFFGFDGADFGVLRRTGGQKEIRRLTITATATASGNVVVQLNSGAGVTIAVVIGDTPAEISRKIADADFSSEDGGWEVFDSGGSVAFLAINTSTRAGAYTFTPNATGVTASFTTEATAVTDTEYWATQADWSNDQADGTGILPMLNTDKGNVFKIVYQYLGYGSVYFFIENPETGRYVLAHQIKYANANTEPLVRQPDLSLFACASNGATTANLQIYTASMGAATFGKLAPLFVRHTAFNTKNVSTEAVILAIKSKQAFDGLTNRIRAFVDFITFGNENGSGKIAIFRIYINPGLVGAPSWSDVHASDSIMEVDTTATGITAGTGEKLLEFIVTAASGGLEAFEDRLAVEMEAGDVLVITGQISSASDLSFGFSWAESQ
jgi:hypothetical protein